MIESLDRINAVTTSALSRTLAAVQPTLASALLGSTGLGSKLAIHGSLSTILTDVAADMPDLSDTRITRETPVLRGARINREARVERETPVSPNSPIAHIVRVVPVVRA